MISMTAGRTQKIYCDTHKSRKTHKNEIRRKYSFNKLPHPALTDIILKIHLTLKRLSNII